LAVQPDITALNPHLAVHNTLAYRQFGADGGRLVVYFHGTPGAPEECAVFDECGKESNLTFISYDRFSINPALKGVAYYQFLANQITAKAAGKTVDLVGFSIGGFIALQVCRYMASHVQSLHLVSAAAPLEANNFIDSMAGKSVFRQAQKHPLVFHLLARVQGLVAIACPGLLFRMLFASATGEDKSLAANDAFKIAITEMLKLSYSNYAAGYARDIAAYVQPWQNTLSGVETKTHIWHGSEDNWSPAAMAEYLQSALPGCVSVNILDGLSHYSCLYQSAPAICTLLSSAAGGQR
jgi:pimeloyl-ACP methyl ester carboxylesterase